MVAPTPPEERSAVFALFWSRPMRRYQMAVFAGFGLLTGATIALGVSMATPAPDGALSGASFVCLFGCLAGAFVAVLALALRRDALDRLAYPPCPKCHRENLWTSSFCRSCGAALPVSPGAAGSLPAAAPRAR